jgi:hypothetical protein
VAKAVEILGHWLPQDSTVFAGIATALSEACSNVALHSGDAGVITIQKYDRSPARVEVDLAVGDTGIGIRQSLQNTYPELAGHDGDFIQRAIAGLSANRDRLGGGGLQRIPDIVLENGGVFQIHSGTGRLALSCRRTPELRIDTDPSAYLSGTQLTITLRGGH